MGSYIEFIKEMFAFQIKIKIFRVIKIFHNKIYKFSTEILELSNKGQKS